MPHKRNFAEHRGADPERNLSYSASTEHTERQAAADGDRATARLIEDVAGLVDSDRDSHGDAVDQQAAAAEVWTWYLDHHDMLRADAVRMMVLLKMSRAAVGEYDLDHDRDIVGYGGIAGSSAVCEGDADESELTRDGKRTGPGPGPSRSASGSGDSI